MTENISEEVKKEILRLISIPGVEISDISKQVNMRFKTELDSEKVMDILADEFLKHNLDYGRRICCRW
jgi:hypothetical protein